MKLASKITGWATAAGIVAWLFIIIGTYDDSNYATMLPGILWAIPLAGLWGVHKWFQARANKAATRP